MPANGASPSGMITTSSALIRVQAIMTTGQADLYLIQKGEGGDWFKVPNADVLRLDANDATKSIGQILIPNPVASTAFHVLQERSGTLSAYIAGVSSTTEVTELAATTLTVSGNGTLAGTLAVTGASTLTGQLNANGGAKLAGSAPSAAADAVGLGVADINGATTAAIREVFEGGGSLTRRVYSTSGAVKMIYIDEAVADDATISLPVPSSGCVGMLDLATLVEGGKVAIQADGTCTVLSGSANLVATDTDAKLAVFNDSATPKIKNRLGGSRRVLATYSWS